MPSSWQIVVLFFHIAVFVYVPIQESKGPLHRCCHLLVCDPIQESHGPLLHAAIFFVENTSPLPPRRHLLCIVLFIYDVILDKWGSFHRPKYFDIVVLFMFWLEVVRTSCARSSTAILPAESPFLRCCLLHGLLPTNAHPLLTDVDVFIHSSLPRNLHLSRRLHVRHLPGKHQSSSSMPPFFLCFYLPASCTLKTCISITAVSS